MYTETIGNGSGTYNVTADGHGGTLITDPAVVAQNQLTQPYA